MSLSEDGVKQRNALSSLVNLAEKMESTEQAKEDMDESSAFECNICYEISQEPVVTLCGHLYCWPCLYRYVVWIFVFHGVMAGCMSVVPSLTGLFVPRWMQVQNHCRVCPVCKAGIDEDKVH